MVRIWPFVALLLAAAAGVALGIGGYRQLRTADESLSLTMEQFERPRPLPQVALTDHQGQPFGRDQLLGHWTLLFAGYSYCPDVCPTTLAQLAGIYGELTEALPGLQVVMLSVDPARDGDGRLASYVPAFHPQFVGVSGPHPQLLQLTRAIGLVYAMVDDPGGSERYLVDHSASLVVIDPQGQALGRFAPSTQVGTAGLFDSQQLLRELPLLANR